MATERSLTCPRCNGGMEQGFQIDIGYGSKSVPKWVAGEPQRSFWAGLKLGGKDQLEVLTYRCRSCGYLESYA
jgi:hypothetical protein